MNGEMIYQ